MKLKSNVWILLLCAASISRAQIPTQMSFQGRIELPKAELESVGVGQGSGNKDNSQSVPFDGTGRFKFSIVSSTGAVLWTNVPGNFSIIPPSALSLPVRNGIFSVGLGDTALGMPPVTDSVFDGPDRLIRIFFQGEVRHGNQVRLTSERELLPAQKLLAVPFAFRTVTAQQAISKPALEVLLAGATIQGTFAITQNAVVLGSAVVHGSVIARSASIGKGTIHIGPSSSIADDNVISFSSAGAINTTGGGLSVNAAGGVGINDLSTGAVSLAAGGGDVLISTPAGSGKVGIGTGAPASKLHVSAGAGETADVLIVSTGTSAVFRVNGSGEVRASKYFGDASALTGIAGGGASAEVALSTINATTETTFGAINVTTNVRINGILDLQAGLGGGLAPDGSPYAMRVTHDSIAWTMLFEDSSNPLISPNVFYSAANFMHLGGPLDSSGSIQISGTTLGDPNIRLKGNVEILGSLSASGSKNFIQPDPADDRKEIVFYSLEGPESGTYVRGTSRLVRGEAVVELPELFGKVTSSTAPITAQVTPLDECNGLRVVQRTAKRMVVRELAGGRSNASFDWLVHGIRAGYEDSPTWRYKTDAENFSLPKGRGKSGRRR